MIIFVSYTQTYLVYLLKNNTAFPNIHAQLFVIEISSQYALSVRPIKLSPAVTSIIQ